MLCGSVGMVNVYATEAEIPNIMTRVFMQYYKLQDSQNFTPTYEYITMKD